MIAEFEVLLEMSDCALHSLDNGESDRIESALPFNPTYYDGSPACYFEIVARNNNASNDYSVYLKDSESAVIATIVVPANTVDPTRFRSSLITSLPADTYHVGLQQTAVVQNLISYTNRIVVHQADPTKTRIQLCLCGLEGLGTEYAGYEGVDYTPLANYNTGTIDAYISLFRKIPGLFSTIPANGWAFEICHWRFVSGSSYVALFNKTTGNMVAGTELNTSSLTPFVQSVSFSASAANFSDNCVYEVRHKNSSGGSWIARACLYVIVNPIVLLSNYKRIAKATTSVSMIYSRAIAHGATKCEVIAKDSEGTGIITLEDAGSADNGEASSPVSGSSLTGFTATKSVKQRISLTCSSGNRFIAKNTGDVDRVTAIHLIEEFGTSGDEGGSSIIFPALNIPLNFRRTLKVDVRQRRRGNLTLERELRSGHIQHIYEYVWAVMTPEDRLLLDAFFTACAGRYARNIAHTDPYDLRVATCRLDQDSLDMMAPNCYIWSGSIRLAEIADWEASKTYVPVFPSSVPSQQYTTHRAFRTEIAGADDFEEKSYQDYSTSIRRWSVGSLALFDDEAADLLACWEGAFGPYREIAFTDADGDYHAHCHFLETELMHEIVAPGTHSIKATIEEIL
jgi:hypothetical protein